MGQPLPTDAAAMRRYAEDYRYDPVGNFLALAHHAIGGNWTRTYAYEGPSSLAVNNRLTRTTVGAVAEEPYRYDADGNMTAMPHLAAMTWNFKDAAPLDAATGRDSRQGRRPPITSTTQAASAPVR